MLKKSELPLLIVIPARLKSSRLPNKLLLDLGGQTVLQRTWSQCMAVKHPVDVVIATDSELILEQAEAFGAKVFLSKKEHLTGTSRCLELWHNLSTNGALYGGMINVQGDEPFVPTTLIEDLCLERLERKEEVLTVAAPISDLNDLKAPQVVKVVFSEFNGRVHYFSRHAIPFVRDEPIDRWLLKQNHWRHIGLYAFSSEACTSSKLALSSPLAESEKLEQLAWLDRGLSIGIWRSENIPPGIDTPEDLERARTRIARNNDELFM